jgi:plasmid maintenance system antidote protein VapI
MENIKDMILAIYEEKRKINQAYSFRALSRDLKIYPSQLSRIVNSKHGATAQIAYRLGRYLKLNDQELIKLIETTIEH